MSDTHKDKRKDEHRDRKREHMERRKGHGLTYRDMQDEFGISKSKIHRDLQDDKNSGD